MTGEAWVIALFAYSLCGGVVALWLWPVRSEQSGADELLRGLIFVGWWCALLVVTLVVLQRGCSYVLAWCRARRDARRFRRNVYEIVLRAGRISPNEVRALRSHWTMARKGRSPADEAKIPDGGGK